MRSEWIEKGEMEHVLAALMPENRLACEISLATGLRINDVLSLKASDVKKQRFTIREQKTGKHVPCIFPRRCGGLVLKIRDRFSSSLIGSTAENTAQDRRFSKI